MHDVLFTLDLGTTSCKAVVFDLSGAVLGEAHQEYPTFHPEPGAAEQDASDWYAAAVAAGRVALDAAGVTAEQAGRVLAIGLSAQRETVVPVDAAGRPLRRALTWLDRRSRPQAEALARSMGAEALHARTGMLPEATFTATKLRWLGDNSPAAAEKATWFLQPKDYLILKLTGSPVIDPSLASRSLLWSIRDGWLPDLIEWAGIRADQLPHVAPSGSVVGHLTATAAADFGLTAGIPVACGAGDRCCEALGAGVRPGGRAMISTGTATNVSGALDKLPASLVSGIIYTRAAIPDQWLAEQGISTGGSVLKWLRDSLGEPDYAELNRLGASAPPGAHGLVLLPYFMGARATRWNPVARGTWLGLSLGHTRGDLARSVMEGVACEVRACLEVLQRAGEVPPELVMLGGGAASPLWCQIKADLIGRPVIVPRTPGAASVGAMLLAGQAIGLWSDPAAEAVRLNPPKQHFAPNENRHRFYDRLYGLYSRLYDSVAPLYEELAALAAEEG